MNNKCSNVISWKTCLRIGITALVVYLCAKYWSGVEGFFGLLIGGSTAMLSGFIIAYIVNIPMRFFERKLPGETGDGTLNRTLSMGLAIVCIAGAVLFVGILVTPQLVKAIVTLAENAPAIVDGITKNEFICSFVPADILAQLENINWNELIQEAASWLQSGVVSSIPQITTLFGQIGAWFMGIVFAFWFLSEKDLLSYQFHRITRNYAGEEVDEGLVRVIKLFDTCFHSYFVGQSLEAVIFGGLVALVSGLLGLPYALMVGALIGVMSLIPMVGALIGAILSAFIILMTSWQQAIIFLIAFFVIQQIEANFIYARVVGKHVGLTGLWPLVGVTLGVALFGIVGAFVGVPLVAAIFRIVEADLNRREQSPSKLPTPLEKFKKAIADN